MNIFITNTHSRKDMLVATTTAHQLNKNISIFNPIDIYEIAINYKASYIILEDKDYNNIYIEKFINDMINNHISVGTKIIFLQKKQDLPKHNNIVSIPIESFCHYAEYISINCVDNNYILCELNPITQKKNGIIEPLLYPNNTNKKIKLVNNPRFDHPQNLGIVNEKDMLDLISKCSIFIGLTDNYIYDAINLKKPTLTTEKNKILDTCNDLSIDFINDYIINYDKDNTHSNLQKYKISNIIKHIIK